jgi:hypothetical protein
VRWNISCPLKFQVKNAHKEHTKSKGLTAEGVVEPVTDADQRSNAIFVNGYR